MSEWLQSLTVVALAAAPVVELRGAIPLALFQYELTPWAAAGLAVLGNLIPVPLLLLGLPRLLDWSRRFAWLARPLDWWTARTRRKHSSTFVRLGAAALIVFVAVPLPATGAWTGSLAAVLFGVPFRLALPLIALGVVVAATAVTLISLGILSVQ